jgi:hypothetical protein
MKRENFSIDYLCRWRAGTVALDPGRPTGWGGGNDFVVFLFLIQFPRGPRNIVLVVRNGLIHFLWIMSFFLV